MSGGTRMIENLRPVIAGLGPVSVPSAMALQFVAKTWAPEGPKEREDQERRFDKLFDDLIWYANALQAARRAT